MENNNNQPEIEVLEVCKIEETDLKDSLTKLINEKNESMEWYLKNEVAIVGGLSAAGAIAIFSIITGAIGLANSSGNALALSLFSGIHSLLPMIPVIASSKHIEYARKQWQEGQAKLDAFVKDNNISPDNYDKINSEIQKNRHRR